MAASSWRRLSISAKLCAESLGGLVQGGFHGREFVVLALVETGAQVAFGMRRAKSTTRCRRPVTRSGGPGGEGQRHGEGNQAGPEGFPAQTTEVPLLAVPHEQR